MRWQCHWAPRLMILMLLGPSIRPLSAEEPVRVDIISNKSFEATVEQIEWHIGGYGMTVTSALDYRQMLKKGDLEVANGIMFEVMRQPWISKIFKHNETSILALPLRITVVKRTSDQKTIVSYYKPSALIGSSNETSLNKLGIELDEKLETLIKRATH